MQPPDMQRGTGGFCVASDSQFSNWEDLEISSPETWEWSGWTEQYNTGNDAGEHWQDFDWN